MHSRAGQTSITETIWVCDALHHDLHTGKRTVQLRDGRWINENGTVSNPYDQPTIWDHDP